MYFGSVTAIRGSVTVSHGASVGASSRQDTTVAFQGAVVGDKVLTTPAVANGNAAIVSVPSPDVTTAGVITISVGNLSTATQSAGTAVAYDITILHPTGESNTASA